MIPARRIGLVRWRTAPRSSRVDRWGETCIAPGRDPPQPQGTSLVDPRSHAWFRRVFGRAVPPAVRTIDFLVGLNQRLAKDIRYLIRMEPGVQSPEQTLIRTFRSCRDSGLDRVRSHIGSAHGRSGHGSKLQHQLGIAADLQRLWWSATQGAMGVVQRQHHDAASSSSAARETLDRLTWCAPGSITSLIRVARAG